MDDKALGSCPCVIEKVQTLKDGGARITLDIPEIHSDVATEVMLYKLKGKSLIQAAFVELSEEDFLNNG